MLLRYLSVHNVSGLARGLYRYLPLSHELVLIKEDEAIGDKTAMAVMGQNFVATAAVTFIWSTVVYRMEWRYSLSAHKVIALDAGHVCQNLYLACEAIGAGTCAIAAYDQAAIDKLVGVDGDDEFVVYLAPVGKG
jgi:SagB-type dehydrogenase family enzyme